LSRNKTGLTQKQGIVNDQRRIEPTDGYTIRDLEEVSRSSQQSQAETKLRVPEGWRRNLKLDVYIGTLLLRPDVEILLSVTGLIQPEQQGMSGFKAALTRLCQHKQDAQLGLHKSPSHGCPEAKANADLGTKKDYCSSPVWDH
jgi:hypothetical protein